MGKWTTEAHRQIEKFTKRMVQADAMQLVAYWAQELGHKKSEKQWMPLVIKIIKQSRPYKERSLFEKLVSVDKFLQLFWSPDPKQPAVTEDVKSEVFDFVLASARKLDRSRPNAVIPRFLKRDFKKAGMNLTFAALRVMSRPKKKQLNIGALILLALIASDWK